jgi:hypothetical protein
MSGRVTVQCRFAGGDGTAGRSGEVEWTNLRVKERELGLGTLRPLLAKAMNSSADALNYMQFQDGDGDWITVCKDADILDGVDELGGSRLRLQILWRGARDAFTKQLDPVGAGVSAAVAPLIGGGPLGGGSEEQRRHGASAAVASGGGGRHAELGRALADAIERRDLGGATRACGRALDAGMTLDGGVYNAMLSLAVDRESLDGAVEAFRLLKRGGGAPDAVAYNALMTVATDCGDLKLAVRTLQRALKHHCLLDAPLVEAVHRACAEQALQVKGRLWQAAQQRLAEQGHFSTLKSYEAASQLAAQAREGRSQRLWAERGKLEPKSGPTDGARPGQGATPVAVAAEAATAGMDPADVAAKKRRYQEIFERIVRGEATDAENSEAEAIAEELGPALETMDDPETTAAQTPEPEAAEVKAGGPSPAAPPPPGARGPPAAPPPPGSRGPPAAPNVSAARKAELASLPQFKLKAAAKAAGVPPLPIGVPARTKDETVALILEHEQITHGGIADARAHLHHVSNDSDGSPPAPAPAPAPAQQAPATVPQVAAVQSPFAWPA